MFIGVMVEPQFALSGCIVMSDVSIQLMTESEFTAVREEWNALLSRNYNKSIFLTWEWLYSWWQHFRTPNSVLSVVCARDNTGNLKGIMPTYHEQDGRRARMRSLHFLGNEEACSDFLDLIVEQGREDEIVPRLLNFALDRWDSCGWDLSDIPASSGNLIHIESILRERKLRYLLRDWQICPFFELPDTVDAFVKKLKPNMRSNYKLSLNRINRNLGKFIKIYGTTEEFQSIIETLFKLHRDRFNMKREDSGFLSERMRRFHLDVGKIFHERGWSRFYAIEADGKVVGSLYCFVYGGRTFYYQAGFDPDYEFLSVGLVLLGKGMEDSIQNGIRMFEFLRGAEAYKWRWTNTYRKTVRVVVYPKDVFGTAKYQYDRLRQAINDNLSVLLRRSDNRSIENKQLVNSW